MTGTIRETVYQVSLMIDHEDQAAHLLNNTEAVSIVPLQITGAHEREDRHDIVKYGIGNESG